MTQDGGGIFDINRDISSKAKELSNVYKEQLSQLSKIVKKNPEAKLENQEKIKEEDMPVFLKQTFCGEKEGKARQEKPAQQGVRPEAKPAAQREAQQPSLAKAPQQLELPKPPSPANIPTLKEAAQKLDKDVTELLAKLKVPMTDENKELAKTMLQFKAQVEQKEMRKITSTLAELSNAGKEERQSACFLYKNNISLNKENVERVSCYIKENSQIADKFAKIQDKSANMAARRGNSRMSRIFAKLPGILGKFIIHPDIHNIREMKIALFRLARAMGIEKDLNKAVFRQVSNDVNVKPDSKVIEEVYKQVDLEKLTSALSSELNKFTGDAAEKALLTEVVGLVSQLSQSISGAKLLNEAGISRANEGFPGFYCMNVPIRFGEEISNGRVIIGFQEYGSVDPENVKIDFRVKTEELGFMHFIIEILNNVIQGNVYVENDKTKDLVEKNMVDFKKALLAQLYQIKYIACELIEEGKVKFLSELNFDNLDVLTA